MNKAWSRTRGARLERDTQHTFIRSRQREQEERHETTRARVDKALGDTGDAAVENCVGASSSQQGGVKQPDEDAIRWEDRGMAREQRASGASAASSEIGGRPGTPRRRAWRSARAWRCYILAPAIWLRPADCQLYMACPRKFLVSLLEYSLQNPAKASSTPFEIPQKHHCI